jgi:glyoxylase I family protein
MKITGVHLCFEVRDFAVARRFWEPLCASLGFPPLWGDGQHFAGFGDGRTMLFVGESTPPRVQREAPTGQEFVVTDHVGLHVAAREDVDAVAADMAAAGFAPLFPAREYPEFGPGFYAVTFCDPDHNVIEFSWRPPRPPAG